MTTRLLYSRYTLDDHRLLNPSIGNKQTVKKIGLAAGVGFGIVRGLDSQRADFYHIPLSIGAPAAAVMVLAAPLLAALAAIAALVKECTTEIEKEEDTDENKN